METNQHSDIRHFASLHKLPTTLSTLGKKYIAAALKPTETQFQAKHWHAIFTFLQLISKYLM